jgi:hypothetical protein
MGWRDRDYARWTPEERHRFFGGSGNGRKPVIAGGAGFAAAISLGLLVLGQVPSGHPVISALHFDVGPRSTARMSLPRFRSASAALPLIAGPTVVEAGTSADFGGQTPRTGNGQVTIRGSLDGTTWETLAVADGSSGRYVATISFRTPGTLVLHAQFTDGEVATWTVRVLSGSGTRA